MSCKEPVISLMLLSFFLSHYLSIYISISDSGLYFELIACPSQGRCKG